MSYDTRCLMTAEYFLGQPRTKDDEESLANAIQAAVENWFLAREARDALFAHVERLNERLEKLVDSHREQVL